ncbi:nitroreductase family protein [Pseudomonadota bacterium]
MFNPRTPDHPINALFIDRWSPRAFDAQDMPKDDLLSMLEAARWAPSAYNIQPWRFLYALRGDENWTRFVEILNPFNASWAQDASALIIVLSDTEMPDDGSGEAKPSHTHSFDVGAAWVQLALQATALGYNAHAMAGIEYDVARKSLGVPNRYQVQIAVAVGKQGDASVLPPELQEREVPSPRLAVAEIAFSGAFPL